ncbi:extracellular catalytic domain type 1 short-chain-length polyhydroxyalkanoate depolymerase [Rubinisphaera brasiliensis]|uniref:EF hand repeat-containing protein n=1 Tax=Rubinisphaera brasiliensis (strain ATCC 49424 / DSM 5305 / JCM 21570 / IAM 15109 / NBRC 103401 / IFAM 1448) TaxID=756272 RepID=F0SS26_RUBBR|nr:PHB depolymerase family esterase [Rubinisphaera brasiliensis]ADY61364.1 EF hand repeat-containing protein [Rubinisphaera brasiliensis DSM 5305]
MKYIVRIGSVALILFVAAVISRRISLAQDGNRLKQAFERIDVDHDGKLSVAEISRFAPLKSRLDGADVDGDGLVTKAEFRNKIAGSMQRLEPTTGKLAIGDSLRIVKVGDLERRYRVHVPQSYDANQATPVVIAFHGGGGNPESMIQFSGLDKKSDEAGFIVVYPYGTGQQKDRGLTFNGGGCCGYAKNRGIDDIGFVNALLDDLERAAAVDTSRIFATGISNGGIMTYYVASELSHRIAAIAPVGGPMMTDTCNPKRPVPVIHFHGTADGLAPFEGGKGKGSPGVPAFFRPEFNSVEYSINHWIRANDCDPQPVVEALPDTADDGMTVTRKTWGNGTDGAEVVLIEIKNGGHTWPGMKSVSPEVLGESTLDISANDLMWEFFQKHPLRQK